MPVLSLVVSLILLQAPVVTDPAWRSRPSPGDIQKRYPAKAQKDWVEGRAILRCTVRKTGQLTDCKVLSETPPDYGFGEAAMSLASLIDMRPGTVDGDPVEGLVDVPIVFKLPISDVPLPDMAGTLRCYGMITVHAKASPRDKLLKGAAAETLRRVRNLSMFTPWSEADLQAQLAAAEASAAQAWRDGFDDERCLLLFSP